MKFYFGTNRVTPSLAWKNCKVGWLLGSAKRGDWLDRLSELLAAQRNWTMRRLTLRPWLTGLVVASSPFGVMAQCYDRPTAQEYINHFGGQLIPAGKLELDGRRMTCGNHPTVLDGNLNDYSAAYRRFGILNPRLLARLKPVVKFWAFGMACGLQMRGPNYIAADCFSVKMGIKEGWLTPEGLNDICAFIEPARGDKDHLPGPQRCERMRKCYGEITSRK